MSKELKISADGWWMVQMIVRCMLATARTQRMTTAAAWPSSPEVGSSMKMTLGLATSSTAMLRRLRCREITKYKVMKQLVMYENKANA